MQSRLPLLGIGVVVPDACTEETPVFGKTRYCSCRAPPGITQSNLGRTAIETAPIVTCSINPDSVLLKTSQNLPVGDEGSYDTPNPGRHSSLGRCKKELLAVGAKVKPLRVSVLLQQFTAMRACAYHGLISGTEWQERGKRRMSTQL